MASMSALLPGLHPAQHVVIRRDACIGHSPTVEQYPPGFRGSGQSRRSSLQGLLEVEVRRMPALMLAVLAPGFCAEPEGEAAFHE